MAINYTTILKTPKPDAGTAAWATYMHRLADILDGGVVTVTKTTGATTFADAQGVADNGKKPVIRSSVTLTGAVTVGVPAKHRFILAENFTGGTASWKIQTASNSIGVVVPKNKRMWLRSTTTGVVPASRTDGRSTATETGLAIITASHVASNAITTVKITDANVTLPKLAGGASYGRLMYTATAAGFAWTTLARGTARQVLAMSTAAVTKPVWRDDVLTRVATSTQIALSATSSFTFTHGLTGLTNKYDYRLMQIILVCVTTEQGYSAGDCIFYGDSSAGYDNRGIQLIADSTSTVKLIMSSNINIVNKSSQAGTILTFANWRAIVRVGA